jgi:signal peptidase I
MEPTLLIGDRVAVRKIGPAPTRWDVVTFELRGTTYVKRMVGMGGEAFGIRNGDLYADGRLLVKPDDLSAALRHAIARWDFAASEGSAGPGPGWRRIEDGERITWVRDAPPLRPDGSMVGEPSPYNFALRDGYLVVEGRIEADGALRAVLARTPFGYEGGEPAVRFEAEAGTTGVRVLARRREPSGAWLAPETVLEDPAWRVQGDVRLELAYIDGELRVSTGGRTWRQTTPAPDQPLRVEVGALGAGTSVQRASLDGDQHWSHDHQYAVPGAPRGDGLLPPLATYAFPIPDNAFFALGDNTLNSDDSRTVQKGAIPLDALTGPVLFRLWPPSRIGTVK